MQERVQRIKITDESRWALFYIIPHKAYHVNIEFNRTGRAYPMQASGPNLDNALCGLLANNWYQYMDAGIPLEVMIQEDFPPYQKDLIHKFFDMFAKANGLSLMYPPPE